MGVGSSHWRAVERALLERRRAEVIDAAGPWTGFNIDLGEGVYTIGPGLTGVAEARVDRIVQAVCDFAGGTLCDLRILDLGCHEGGFAVALARRGAEVIAVDGREGHIAKVRFVREALGLENLQPVRTDVRQLIPEDVGTFDVVLCLGVLYHLDGQDVMRMVETVSQLTRRLAVFETQIALKAQFEVSYEENLYFARHYDEDVAEPGASLDNVKSLWLTKPSLLNLLACAGFTSVAEYLNPVIPALAAYKDHTTLIALRGEPATDAPFEQWPESLRLTAHPAQGRRYRLLQRFGRRRFQELLRKSPSQGRS